MRPESAVLYLMWSHHIRTDIHQQTSIFYNISKPDMQSIGDCLLGDLNMNMYETWYVSTIVVVTNIQTNMVAGERNH